MKIFKSLVLCCVLLVGSLCQVACGNGATLDKIGNTAVVLARGFAAEVEALKTGGLTGRKFEAFQRASTKATVAADSLNRILTGAKTIDSSQAAEVARLVAQITNEIGALLINPDFLGLPADSKIVQIAKYTHIALTQLSVTLSLVFPPPPAGQIGTSSASHKVVKTSKIVVTLPPAPPAVQALFN